MTKKELDRKIERSLARVNARLSGAAPTDALAGLAPTGNAAADSRQEVSAMLAAYKQKQNLEKQRLRDATDSEYWFAVCFQTREQKDEFLRKTGWQQEGDKYLDGQYVADQMKIKLPAADVRHQGEKPHPRITADFEPIGEITKGGENK